MSAESTERTHARLGEIVANANIWSGTLNSLYRDTYRPVFHMGELVTALGSNPRFHFTTDAFIYVPQTNEDAAEFKHRVKRKNTWQMTEEPYGLHVVTNYSQNIERDGLRKRSCVATMPQGESEDLMQLHPRLLLQGLERTVFLYGKHAIPYKQDSLQKTRGTIIHIDGALVIADEKVEVEKKGITDRQRLTDQNIFRPRTHFVTEGVDPSQLVVARFGIDTPIGNAYGKTSFNKSDFSMEVISAVTASLPEMVGQAIEKGILPQGGERLQRSAILFSRLAK